MAPLERRLLIITDTLAGLVAGLALHDPDTAVWLLDRSEEKAQAAGLWCFPAEGSKYLHQLTAYLSLELVEQRTISCETGQLRRWKGGLPAALHALHCSLGDALLQPIGEGVTVHRLPDSSFAVAVLDRQVHCMQLAVVLRDPSCLHYEPPLSVDVSIHRATEIHVTYLQYSTRFWEQQRFQPEALEQPNQQLFRSIFDVSTGKKSCIAVAHTEPTPHKDIAHCISRGFDTDLLPIAVETSSTSFAEPVGMSVGKPALVAVDGVVVVPMKCLTLEGQVHAGRLVAKHFSGPRHPHASHPESGDGNTYEIPSSTSSLPLDIPTPSERLGIKNFAIPPDLELPFMAEVGMGREVFPASLAEHTLGCLGEAAAIIDTVRGSHTDAETFAVLSQWRHQRGTSLFQQVQALGSDLQACVFPPGPALPHAAAMTEYFQLLREKVQIVCAWFDSVLDVFMVQCATSGSSEETSEGAAGQGQYASLFDSLVLAEAVDGELREVDKTAAEYKWAVQRLLAQLHPDTAHRANSQQGMAQLIALQERLVEVVVRAKRVQVVEGSVSAEEPVDALEGLHQPTIQYTASELESLERLSNYVEMALGNMNPATAQMAQELSKYRDHCDSLEVQFFTLIDGRDPKAPLSVQFQKDFVALRKQASEYRSVLGHRRDQDLADLRKAWSPLVETYNLLIGMLDSLLENMADYERQIGPIAEPDWLSVLWDWKAHLMQICTSRPQVEQQEGGNDAL
eukprot:GGOE01002583.1.p1 GENE.GGOE01002583.1~~GGOE01002583.1.p1  ORF type:complete len:737 (-),score=166.51 GGOE01002583.1:220-2430(-)